MSASTPNGSSEKPRAWGLLSALGRAAGWVRRNPDTTIALFAGVMIPLSIFVVGAWTIKASSRAALLTLAISQLERRSSPPELRSLAVDILRRHSLLDNEELFERIEGGELYLLMDESERLDDHQYEIDRLALLYEQWYSVAASGDSSDVALTYAATVGDHLVSECTSMERRLRQIDSSLLRQRPNQELGRHVYLAIANAIPAIVLFHRGDERASRYALAVLRNCEDGATAWRDISVRAQRLGIETSAFVKQEWYTHDVESQRVQLLAYKAYALTILFDGGETSKAEACSAIKTVDDERYFPNRPGDNAILIPVVEQLGCP